MHSGLESHLNFLMGLKYPINLFIDIIKQLSLTMKMSVLCGTICLSLIAPFNQLGPLCVTLERL